MSEVYAGSMDPPNNDEEAFPNGNGSDSNSQPKYTPDAIAIVDKDVIFRTNNEFTPIRDEAADTAVYIGAPPRVPGQSIEEYQHVFNHFNQVHLMQSHNFKVLGSSQLDKLFTPNISIRAEKRFKKLDAYNHLDSKVKAQIKYHVDLRPPEDGDEAALLMMGLSCAEGLRKWHLAADLYNISPEKVAGVDNFDTPENPYYMTIFEALNVVLPQKRKAEQKTKVEIPVTAEYCPIRHRSAIERFINAVHNHDPKIDSAPKMWTYFAVLVHFGVAAQFKIQQPIFNWFNQYGNSEFVQNNPEICYRIGMACHHSDFVRDTFSILVGEKALGDLSSQLRGHVASTSHSTHGRPLEILDDDEQSRVGHAASSLIARIQETIYNLAVVGDWLPKSREFEKILNFKPDNDEQAQMIILAKKAIHQYLTNRILEYLLTPVQGIHADLCQTQPGLNPQDHSNYVLSLLETFNALPYRAKILSRTFWLALGEIDFRTDYSQRDGFANFNTAAYKQTIARLAKQNQQDPLLSNIDYGNYAASNVDSILRKVKMVNDMIRVRYHSPSSSTAGSDQPAMSAAADPNVGSSSGFRRHVWDTTVYSKRQEIDHILDSSPGKRRKTLEYEEIPPSPLAKFSSLDSQGTDIGMSTSNDAMAGGILIRPKPKSKPFQGDVTDWWTEGMEMSGPGPAVKAEPASTDDYDQAFDFLPTVPTHIPSTTVPAQTSPTTSMHRRVMQQFSDIPAPAPYPMSSAQASSSTPFKYPQKGILKSPEIIPNRLIDCSQMLSEFSTIVNGLAQKIALPEHLFHGTSQVPVNKCDFVLALTDAEWKFLPLWVQDGCDDGTGGVFEDAIPNLEGNGGFRGGKRGMHAKHITLTANGSEMSIMDGSETSSISEISGREALSSTARASQAATDGTTTVKSFDGKMSESGSEEGFMNQDEIYALVQEMKAEQAVKEAEAQGEGTGAENTEVGGRDDSTIMGARSDDELFGGSDGEAEAEATGEDPIPDFLDDEEIEVGGFEDDDVFMAGDDDSDLEVIDKTRL